MTDITENIYWLSDGREPSSGSILYILFNFYKNGMEMFVHCFIEKVNFLNTSTKE